MRDNVGGVERRGDYGYDAPYALLMFAALGAASLVAAIAAWWTYRGPAAALALYGVFFLANAASFLYTTRRGKFLVWEESALRQDPARARRDGSGAPPARVALLVRESVRRHYPGDGRETVRMA